MGYQEKTKFKNYSDCGRHRDTNQRNEHIFNEIISEREFRMYIIKTIREANEEMKEQVQALKEEMKE